MTSSILTISLLVSSAIFKAFMDLSSDGKLKYSLNKKNTWKNKYKPNKLTPKFFGSTTFLVFLTDFWHLMQLLHQATWMLAFSLNFNETFLVFIFIFVSYNTIFELIYRRF